MEDKIYLKETKKYLQADERTKNDMKFRRNPYFDLGSITNEELRNEMKSFIKYREDKLTIYSLYTELSAFQNFVKFLNEVCPQLGSLKDADYEVMERDIKKWLLKKGIPISQKRRSNKEGSFYKADNPVIAYYRQFYTFLNPKEEVFRKDSDRWYLKDIPLSIKINPIKQAKSISFQKIRSVKMREEIKEVIYCHLTQKAVGTVTAEMSAVNRFCRYLDNTDSEIESLTEMERSLMEDYLIYLHTEEGYRKSYASDLHALKAVFVTAGKILEEEKLEKMIIIDDIANDSKKLYRVYSDSELKRLNEAIVQSDPQVARALMIHQMLGTRISESLTLKRDAIFQGKTGKWMIKIQQVKTRRSYIKAINDDTRKLFLKACEYTQEMYGDTDYVFVRDSDPRNPMTYVKIQSQLMSMVRRFELKDDHGEPFGVGTHIWRHCYGKKLTEMHVDDFTIERLLGHSSMGNLERYRKIGNEMLSKETRDMRDKMDSVLKKIVGEW